MNRSDDSVFDSREDEEAGWASREITAMAAAFARGEPISAAAIIEAHPEIDSESAIRLIYEEVCLRREAGETVSSAEVTARFPIYAEDLDALFECDRLINQEDRAIVFPEVGERVLTFRLVAELGRGASGRTYLAIDAGLADRPVVLKMIPRDQEEHLALATLRHTHIVPLLTDYTLPERGLRIICMPYLGGTSLSRILSELEKESPRDLDGKRLVSVIEKTTLRPAGLKLPTESPYRRRLEAAEYVDAVVWITACLADGLDYAHNRDVIHMDIKASNVLIALDGQPMLLDFHLSHAPIQAGEWVLDRLGGTQGCMSPEQESALASVARGECVPRTVDRRSDIYALGLLLRDMLFLPKPDPGRPSRGDASESPLPISIGLTDIILKCLKPNPEERYQDAARLADDLRRHLAHQPLLGVRNRSWAESIAKWRHRHPGGPAWVTAALVLCVAVAALGVAYRQAERDLDNKILRAELLRSHGDYEAASRALGEVEAAYHWIFGPGIRGRHEREMRLIRRERLARDAHAIAENCRLSYGFELPSGLEAEQLAERCRVFWERRSSLAPPPGTAEDSKLDRSIRADVLEIAAMLHDLRLRREPADPHELAETRSALKEILTASLREYGESFAIRERLAALEEQTAGAVAKSFEAKSPFDHFDRGRGFLRRGKLKEAVDEFDLTLAAAPSHFWANFYKGECDYRLGRFDRAVTDFHGCVLMNPTFARSYHDRGRALQAVDRLGEAERDYARAVELDSTLAPAWLNRGVLAYHGKRLDDAARYLGAGVEALRGASSASDRDTLARLHYNLALVENRRGNLQAAWAHADRAERLGLFEATELKQRLR